MQTAFVTLLYPICVSSHDDGSLFAPHNWRGSGQISRDQRWNVMGLGAAPKAEVDCALPEIQADSRFACPDQTLTLEERRNKFEDMKPFDLINGERLDDKWPASGSTHVADTQKWNLDGIQYNRYQLSRKAGERSPIHYHENAQITCLKQGKVMLFQEGEENQVFEAPDCYLMPPYKKMSALSLTDKIEEELFHVPEGGLDWVVIEPNYYYLQGQWEDEPEPENDASDAAKAQQPLGASSRATMCPPNECPIYGANGNLACVGEGWTVEPWNTFPQSACRVGNAVCVRFSANEMTWVCEE